MDPSLEVLHCYEFLCLALEESIVEEFEPHLISFLAWIGKELVLIAKSPRQNVQILRLLRPEAAIGPDDSILDHISLFNFLSFLQLDHRAHGHFLFKYCRHADSAWNR